MGVIQEVYMPDKTLIVAQDDNRLFYPKSIVDSMMRAGYKVIYRDKETKKKLSREEIAKNVGY